MPRDFLMEKILSWIQQIFDVITVQKNPILTALSPEKSSDSSSTKWQVCQECQLLSKACEYLPSNGWGPKGDISWLSFPAFSVETMTKADNPLGLATCCARQQRRTWTVQQYFFHSGSGCTQNFTFGHMAAKPHNAPELEQLMITIFIMQTPVQQDLSQYSSHQFQMQLIAETRWTRKGSAFSMN